MRDARYLKERLEVRLDRPHIIWLTLGVMAALGLVFALGFMVGKRTERLTLKEPSTNPVVSADTEKVIHEELTFYRNLTDAPLKDSKKNIPTQKLAENSSNPSTLKEKTKDNPNEQNNNSLLKAIENVRIAVANSTRNELLHAINSGPPKVGEFTVQVSAFQSMAEAKAFSASLERKGYQPFVIKSNIPGRGTWYRVRLGSFVDETQASQAKKLLAQSEIPAWVLQTK